MLTQLRANRLVNPDRTSNRVVATCAIAESGAVVHRKDYGVAKVFWIVTPSRGYCPEGTRILGPERLGMEAGQRLKCAEMA